MERYYKNMPVLITGGAGFIGSHLAEQLVKLKARVTILDDLSTGSLANVESFYNHLSFVQGSIADLDLCQQLAFDKKIIFHLAAQVSVPQSFEDPNTCYRINMQGTQHLLEAARQANVQRFVFASSCAVYGHHDTPLHEQLPCYPQSPYGLSKLLGELLCKQYTRDFGLETVSLRYFNVFGPRQRHDGPYAGVVARFRSSMMHNQPLTIFGDGSQERDFIPVEQVVESNLMAGLLPAKQVCGQTFNVATGSSISLMQLIAQLKKEFPLYNAPIHHQPARPGDIQTVHANIDKYQQIIINQTFNPML